jgi:AcrR family transcriptional regulator
MTKITRDTVVDAGLSIAQRNIFDVTIRKVAWSMNVTPAALYYYFSKSEELRNAVVSIAIKQEDSAVIAQLIVCRDKAVSHLPIRSRARHLARAAQ